MNNHVMTSGVCVSDQGQHIMDALFVFGDCITSV